LTTKKEKQDGILKMTTSFKIVRKEVETHIKVLSGTETEQHRG
jgi:hypothetical protein